MPRVKIQLADNIKRVVVVDTEATKGATLGTDVYLPSGALGSPTTVREWLGLGAAGTSDIRNGYGILISGSGPKTINVNRAADFAWQGQHQWERPLWAPDGTEAAPAYSFTNGQSNGHYLVGTNNVGLATNGVLRWDINTARVLQNINLQVINATRGGASGFEFTTAVSGTPADGVESVLAQWEDDLRLYGFRWKLDGTVAATGDLILYQHNNSAAGQEVFRISRDVRQIQGFDGTIANPFYGFSTDRDLGVYRFGTDQLGISALEDVIHTANGSGTGFITLNLNATSTAGYSVADELSVVKARFGYSNNTDRPFFNVTGPLDMTFQQDSSVMIDWLAAGHWQTRDNVELRAGTGGDLRLFHNGTNSTIRNDTGDLLFLAGATEVARINASTPRFRLLDGTAGAPSWAFQSDTDNGAYYIGTNSWGLSVGGTLAVQLGFTSQARGVGITAALLCSGVISPAQLTGNTDNWSPTGLSTCSVIRFSTDASRNITGIVAQGSGTRILLINTGTADAVLVNDATSTAANRFLCPGAANFTLNGGDSVEIWYDSTSSRWRVIES